MKAGIVGLPNVGKSTLFNCLSNAKAQSANFPFCTIEPNVGVVNVPDSRINKLQELVNPERVIPASVEIVDIAGLVKGASKGEGLGNQFLANIRETDAIIHVLRCFDNDNIVHVDGDIDPIRDKETIDIELQLKDLETVEKKLDKVKRSAKTPYFFYFISVQNISPIKYKCRLFHIIINLIPIIFFKVIPFCHNCNCMRPF